MEKRTNSTARTLAALSLIAALVVVVAVIAAAGGGSSGGGQDTARHVQKEHKRHRTRARTYTVETGDTLISIAHKTGVPLRQLEALNPEVDPQILVAGEKLKLR